MKKKNLTSLSLNKRKVSKLDESVKNILKGGGTGYNTAVGLCTTNGSGGGSGGGTATLCAYSCSCSLVPNGGC